MSSSDRKELRDIVKEISNIRGDQDVQVTLDTIAELTNKTVNAIKTDSMLSRLQSRYNLHALNSLTQSFDNSNGALDELLKVQQAALEEVKSASLYSRFKEYTITTAKTINNNIKDISKQASPEMALFYNIIALTVTASMKLYSWLRSWFKKEENDKSNDNPSTPPTTPPSKELESLNSRVDAIYDLMRSSSTDITDSEELQARRKAKEEEDKKASPTPPAPTPLNRKEEGGGLMAGMGGLLARGLAFLAPLVMSVVTGLGALLAPLLPAIAIIAGVAAALYVGYKFVDNLMTDLDNAEEILGKTNIDFSDKVAVATGSIVGTIGSLVDTVGGIFGFDTNFEEEWKIGVAQSVAGFFDSVGSIFTNIVDMTTGDWIELGKNAITNAWELLTNGIKDYFSNILSIFGISTDQVDDAFEGFGEAIDETSKVLEDTGKSLKDGLTSIGDTLGSWKDTIGEGLSSGLDYASDAISSLGGTDSGDAVGVVPANNELGAVSAKYESNGNSGAIGVDKTGGWSYGKYQIATKTGTMGEFMKHLSATNPNLAAELNAAGGVSGAASGSDAFKSKWKELAKNSAFTSAEHGFIQSTHYDPLVNKVKKAGLDVTTRSKALQDVVWSTSVQHGGGTDVVNKALSKVGGAGASDEALINAIYEVRRGRFGSSTAKVRASVMDRFDHENKDALAMLKASPGSSPPTTPATPGVPNTNPIASPATPKGILPTTASNSSPVILPTREKLGLPPDMQSAKSAGVVDSMMQNKNNRISNNSSIINNIAPVTVSNNSTSEEKTCSSGTRDPKGVGRGFPSNTAYSQDIGARQSCG